MCSVAALVRMSSACQLQSLTWKELGLHKWDGLLPFLLRFLTGKTDRRDVILHKAPVGKQRGRGVKEITCGAVERPQEKLKYWRHRLCQDALGSLFAPKHALLEGNICDLRCPKQIN